MVLFALCGGQDNLGSTAKVINVDLRLAHYEEQPTTLPSGLRSYRHTERFKQPAPVGLHGDLVLLASLCTSIDMAELAKVDQNRKAGTFLRDKLKGVTLTAFQARVLATLIEEDWEYHQSRREKPVDMTNIEQRGKKFRVQADGKKLTFGTLEEAVKCRDRLRLVKV